jgi:hypothetical protein
MYVGFVVDDVAMGQNFFRVIWFSPVSILPLGLHTCEPGGSVSIVSGYGLDDRAIEVRFPAEAKGFFL